MISTRKDIPFSIKGRGDGHIRFENILLLFIIRIHVLVNHPHTHISSSIFKTGVLFFYLQLQIRIFFLTKRYKKKHQCDETILCKIRDQKMMQMQISKLKQSSMQLQDENNFFFIIIILFFYWSFKRQIYRHGGICIITVRLRNKTCIVIMTKYTNNIYKKKKRNKKKPTKITGMLSETLCRNGWVV